MAFKSIDYNSTSAASYASGYYSQCFGSDSGTVFLIDMHNREIRIFSNGAIERTITAGCANTITDNVYGYASYEEYFTCADEAFNQEYTLLEGGRIAQPMKYMSNAVLALVLAVLINYGLVKIFTKNDKPNSDVALKNLNAQQNVRNLQDEYVNTKRIYSPVESGSSSGGGGGGSSSGGSGGGHSF